MDQIETLIYSSDIASVGTFRCPPDHRRFAGGSTDTHLVVFPRTAVIIERAEVGPVVADPNTAVLYRPGDQYERRGIDRRGDHCDFFAVDPALAEEALGPTGNSPGHAPVSAELYLAQRAIVTTLVDADDPDPLAVEEAALAIFRRAAEGALRDGGTPVETTNDRQAAVVWQARRVLFEQAATRISLAELARAVAVSPFHLARLFRRYTGFTVHRYLTQLRLRRSLDSLAHPDVDIATLALELGFSSHSHFTNVFRTTFGVTPSAYRRGPAGHGDLSKILTV